MSITRYITDLERLRTQYLKEDMGTVLSDRSFAQRMLNRAGLLRKEKNDIFYNAGGEYNSKAIEKVLRRRCAKVHEEDSKRGPAPTSRSARSRSASRPTRHPSRSGKAIVPYKSRPRHGGRRKLRGTHFADEVDDEDFDSADEDDLEEETFEEEEGSDDEAESVEDEGQGTHLADEADEPGESDDDSEASSEIE